MWKVVSLIVLIGNSILVAKANTSKYLNSLGKPSLSTQVDNKIDPFSWTDLKPTPEFNTTLPRNVTALRGTHAYLECIVYNIGNRSVSWIRERDLHILTVNQFTYTSDARFNVIHQPSSSSWVLKIINVQQRDSGKYSCQVNTHALDTITFSVWLNVYVPQAQILGKIERYVDRGSTINLTCIVKHYLQPETDNFWYHNNKMINYDSKESLVSVITDRGPVTKTILLIHDASDSASGTYTCAPSPITSASARIHILNGETPAAMQANICHSVKTSCLLPISLTLITCMDLLSDFT